MNDFPVQLSMKDIMARSEHGEIMNRTWEVRSFDDVNRVILQMIEIAAASVSELLIPASRSKPRRIKNRIDDKKIPTFLMIETSIIPSPSTHKSGWLEFSLLEEESTVAEIAFYFEGDSFSVWHRQTDPAFRNQGIATALLKLGDLFIQEMSDRDQKPKTIRVHHQQLSVLAWLYKNGFRPHERKDEDVFLKIINDENILLGLENHMYFVDGNAKIPAFLTMSRTVNPQVPPIIANTRTVTSSKAETALSHAET